MGPEHIYNRHVPKHTYIFKDIYIVYVRCTLFLRVNTIPLYVTITFCLPVHLKKMRFGLLAPLVTVNNGWNELTEVHKREENGLEGRERKSKSIEGQDRLQCISVYPCVLDSI